MVFEECCRIPSCVVQYLVGDQEVLASPISNVAEVEKLIKSLTRIPIPFER